jgi:hypothetical protein
MNTAAWLVVAGGAFCCGALMAQVGGDWRRALWGWAAWAISPYLVLAATLLAVQVLKPHRPSGRTFAVAVTVGGLLGPLLYVDALYVHPDAQGPLALLTIPLLQVGVATATVVAASAWTHLRRLVHRGKPS